MLYHFFLPLIPPRAEETATTPASSPRSPAVVRSQALNQPQAFTAPSGMARQDVQDQNGLSWLLDEMRPACRMNVEPEHAFAWLAEFPPGIQKTLTRMASRLASSCHRFFLSIDERVFELPAK
jgi:hypothetical protein